MFKKSLKFIVPFFLILNMGGLCAWGAMPQSGNVEGRFELSWEKPHLKGSRLYITLVNGSQSFQTLRGTADLGGGDGNLIGRAFFDVGIPPRKSLRTYGSMDGTVDPDRVESLRWTVE